MAESESKRRDIRLGGRFALTGVCLSGKKSESV